jgi:hypothetical protein
MVRVNYCKEKGLKHRTGPLTNVIQHS